MTLARWACGIAALALASSQASADLRVQAACGVAPVSGQAAGLQSAGAASQPLLASGLTASSAVSVLVGDMVIDPPVSSTPVSADSKNDVIQLPPAPSSAALFLSAMVSLGAWQLARSSRDLHLSAMPEWYHTGAPAQIGHSTVYDFEFSAAAPCLFGDPAPSPVFSHRVARESRLRLSDQPVLSEADPRGPPAQAS